MYSSSPRKYCLSYANFPPNCLQYMGYIYKTFYLHLILQSLSNSNWQCFKTTHNCNCQYSEWFCSNPSYLVPRTYVNVRIITVFFLFLLTHKTLLLQIFALLLHNQVFRFHIHTFTPLLTFLLPFYIHVSDNSRYKAQKKIFMLLIC